MATSTDTDVPHVIRALLYPILRYCLRHIIGFREIIALIKETYIEVAAEEIRRSKKKVNVSRLCVMTGIHRKDITQIINLDSKLEPPVSMVARVLGQWEQDPRFQTSRGTPRALSHEGEQSEFKELVKMVSTDLNAGTILFELERGRHVERKNNRVCLMKKASVETKDREMGIKLLSNDTRDLTSAVFENIDHPEKTAHLHGRTEYDNIAPEDLEVVKLLLLEEGSRFHARARELLSKYDRDVNNKPSSKGRAKVALVTFSYAHTNES